MSGQLSNLGVSHVGGLVRLNFGRTSIDLRHADAAQFAQWVKVHAKEAKRKNRDHDVILPATSIFDRFRTAEPWNQKTMLYEYGKAISQAIARDTPVAVDNDSELVRMAFGGIGYGVHYSVARPFSEAVRLHARAAKLSTGDNSVRQLTTGVLSNAEENYRCG